MRKKVIETTEMLNKQMGDALIELLKEKPISISTQLANKSFPSITIIGLLGSIFCASSLAFFDTLAVVISIPFTDWKEPLKALIFSGDTVLSGEYLLACM